MRNILHITPHLGGGVGRVLLNYLAYTNSHEEDHHAIACLDYANPQAVMRAADLKISLQERMAWQIPDLLQAISNNDVVVIHWWNHPLLYSLLIREQLPPSRILLWSHVSGHTPPQNFTNALLKYPDFFVIATPYSLETPVIKGLDADERDVRIRLVFSCGGTDHVDSVRPRLHEGFRVGYVGTVDYCKMHRNFISMNARADIPDAHFIVCGGPREKLLKEEAELSGYGEKFNFLGHVNENDTKQILSTCDVFGYPLAAGHYGTGEQALIEALAAGVPPVVLDNGPERHIVEDGVTGLVVKGEAEYTAALKILYQQPVFRLTLATQARQRARQKFTIINTAKSWNDIYYEMMMVPKRTRCWPSALCGRKATGAEIFLEALGEHGADYSDSIQCLDDKLAISAQERIAHKEGLLRAETRGSVFHYQSFFPDDPHLNLWCGLMRLAEGTAKEAQHHFSKAGRILKHRRVEPYLDRIGSGYSGNRHSDSLAK